jgi:hypothetical protein
MLLLLRLQLRTKKNVAGHGYPALGCQGFESSGLINIPGQAVMSRQSNKGNEGARLVGCWSLQWRGAGFERHSISPSKSVASA